MKFTATLFNAQPSIDRLRAAFRYEPETGKVFWLESGKGRGRKGGEAGTWQHRYMFLYLDRVRISFHRAAWAIYHGVWPKGVIDHLNGNTKDNRLCNLRDVSHSVNLQNQRRARSDSATGLLGVVSVRPGRWRGQVRVAGVVHRCPLRKSPEEAHADYVEAKRRLHDGCTI